jgi:hypothetical protein
MVNVTCPGCFEGELVKVLQSEKPPVISTQTSNDSPTAICPFGNTISCPSEDIGAALYSSSDLSSPSHSSKYQTCMLLLFLIILCNSFNILQLQEWLYSTIRFVSAYDCNNVTAERNSITKFIFLLIFKIICIII